MDDTASMRLYSVYLREDQIAWLAAEHTRTGAARAELVRRAIDLYRLQAERNVRTIEPVTEAA